MTLRGTSHGHNSSAEQECYFLKLFVGLSPPKKILAINPPFKNEVAGPSQSESSQVRGCEERKTALLIGPTIGALEHRPTVGHNNKNSTTAQKKADKPKRLKIVGKPNDKLQLQGTALFDVGYSLWHRSIALTNRLTSCLLRLFNTVNLCIAARLPCQFTGNYRFEADTILDTNDIISWQIGELGALRYGLTMLTVELEIHPIPNPHNKNLISKAERGRSVINVASYFQDGFMALLGKEKTERLETSVPGHSKIKQKLEGFISHSKTKQKLEGFISHSQTKQKLEGFISHSQTKQKLEGFISQNKTKQKLEGFISLNKTKQKLE
ncbi:hypothetical protein CHS0354_010024 [Potamilus streckersoni]|uniref:Uncharacterized protein n=1 Tax=Potamilus streckersoni TaxID=2493646 RepID=A0AAE0SDK5_9BIVA|nr:hypothetical protein CHS0354_010024 [Potamilus streckersoni]